MTDAEKQHILKNRLCIGGTDAAAICGKSAWRSPMDVYLEKTGLVADEFTGNEATAWGLRMEPVIALAYEDETGFKTIEHTPVLIDDNGEWWASGSPDRLVVPKGKSGWLGDVMHGLEIKNVSLTKKREWGEPGTDQIPPAYLIQSQWYMIVVSIALGFPIIQWDVAALFGGNELRIYTVNHNTALANALWTRCRSFWFDNILAGVAPDNPSPGDRARFLSATYRTHGDVARIASQADEQWADNIFTIQDRIKRLEEHKTAAQNRIKESIGDAEAIAGDTFRASWKANKNGTRVFRITKTKEN